MYRPEKVDAAVQAVWESAPNDAALQEMTPPQFYGYIKGWEISNEEAQFAWYEFSDRVERVFS